MKKQLMTTTALVAAGMLAASGAALAQKKASKPKLVLGGYMEGILGVADNTDSITDGRVFLDVQPDAEVFFKGTMTLDNGIKIRTRVELEGQTGAGNQNQSRSTSDGATVALKSVNVSTDIIDEAYINISGGFGAVRIGSDDNAAHLMVTPYSGSWATNAGQNLNFDVADWVETPGGHSASTVARLSLGDADNEKVTYFTPRIEGLQVGASYMPNINPSREGGIGSPETRVGFFHEGWAIAANFNRKFDNVGIGMAAGYATANPGVANHSDPEGFHVGARVTVGAFRIAYGFRREWNLSSETATNNSGDESHDFGVRYKAGKNNFSLGYMHAEDKNARAVPGEDETDIFMASYRRDLGPGVQYRLNFMYGDYEGENVGSADDNDGIAVTTSVRIAF